MTAARRTVDGMKLLILSSHAILEYDDLRMFSDLGYDVFIPGSYSDPSHPGEAYQLPDGSWGSIRPALPNVPHHPELAELCDEQRARHAEDPSIFIDWAKADLHPKLIDWADAIIVNCFPDAWLGNQWDRIRDKRVIWRTIGQSNAFLEFEMRQYEGLEIVRYSPAEKRAFEPIGNFAGEDAMIRFCKYPTDFYHWTGDNAVVGNVTQNLDQRGEHCGLDFWLAVTEGLPVQLAGTGSERMGGLGHLAYPDMLGYLSRLRAYLYMGTQPASYTLGLMEAMLAGVPVVSIPPDDMWMPALYEGHELVGRWSDVAGSRIALEAYLRSPEDAAADSRLMRERGRELFSPRVIGPQWIDFLGAPASVTWRTPTGATEADMWRNAAHQVTGNYAETLRKLA